MRRRTLLAGVAAGAASALAGCSGAIRELRFSYVTQEETESGVRLEVGVSATTNVQGEKSDFRDVTAVGYTCEGRRVCFAEIGLVPGEASDEDPVVTTMECGTRPDAIALGARTGPCNEGVANFPWALYRERDGWIVNGFDRQCKEKLPPERVCESIGKTRGPGGVIATGTPGEDGNETDSGSGTNGG
ncbi:hypothetical protein BRD00_09840 [Halobacteriales archaeon QS_8_69_26]|nr:MAG: hypothetical protein BRD00_09840 [Halobacteriales archaeon QS_8_69_26]